MSQKKIQGDGREIYHVSKDHPDPEFQDMLLVPGKQNAAGRGVYFSEVPSLSYTGSEYYQGQSTRPGETQERVPIYAIPIQGRWVEVYNHKKGEITFHSDGNYLYFPACEGEETTIDGVPVTIYRPSEEFMLVKEPKTGEGFAKTLREHGFKHESVERLIEDAKLAGKAEIFFVSDIVPPREGLETERKRR